MPDDTTLLRRYLQEKSEPAFAELVRRHIDLVYSVALRQVAGDTHLAEDVVQQVFTALARKARTLGDRPTLTGWLYRSAHFAASDVVRSERRRRAREQEAHAMQEINALPAGEIDWEKVRPGIDAAIAELDERDRDALSLRFFDGCSFAHIGGRLRLTENAARMRVERALDKLHAVLARRGGTSTATALGVALANQVVTSAPAGLAASVTGVATHAAAIAGPLAELIGFMSATKGTITLAAAGALALATGGYQSSQARSANGELAEARRANATLAARFAELATKVSAAEKERAERDAALARAGAEKAAPAATLAGAVPVDDINAKYLEIVNRLAESDSERLKAQDVHERLRAMEIFRPLFLGLGLSPQQVERALDIVWQPLPEARTAFRAAFGEAAADRLAEYRSEGAWAARNLVNDLSAKLYFADAPFQPQQAEQLFQLMKDTGTEPSLYNEKPPDGWARNRDWDRILDQAGSFLAPEQLRGLRAYAALHRNRDLLAAAVNEAATPKP